MSEQHKLLAVLVATLGAGVATASLSFPART